jgi:hypothetical protein
MREYVIAGNRAQAELYAKRTGRSPRDIVIVTRAEDLRGVEGEITLVGEYFTNEAYGSDYFRFLEVNNRITTKYWRGLHG